MQRMQPAERNVLAFRKPIKIRGYIRVQHAYIVCHSWSAALLESSARGRAAGHWACDTGSRGSASYKRIPQIVLVMVLVLELKVSA
jgi:hypothetical protein